MWELIGRPTLNVRAQQASLALAAFVFRTGLLDDAAAGDIGVPRAPLQQLHAEPAARELARAGAEVRTRARVDRIECEPGAAPAVRLDGERIEADALIVATPHREAARLLPAASGVRAGDLEALGASPIVNVHAVYDRRVTELGFAAGIDSPVEWLFDRSAESGLTRGQYLAVSLSAADAWVGTSSAQLRRIFEPELARLLPGARGARLLRLFATCEREATFRPAPGSRRLRPGAQTAAPGLFLAGAYTDTGWPATMEGAVQSGRTAARAALDHVRRRGALDAAA